VALLVARPSHFNQPDYLCTGGGISWVLGPLVEASCWLGRWIRRFLQRHGGVCAFRRIGLIGVKNNTRRYSVLSCR